MNFSRPAARPLTARLPVLLLALALSAAPAGVSARIVYGSLQAGLSIPAQGNRLNDRFDRGFGLGGGAVFVLGEEVNMIVQIEYHSLRNAGLPPLADRGSLRAAMLTTMFRYMFGQDLDPWRPFLGLGFGTADLSLAKEGDTYTEWDGDDLHGVFHVGAGLQVRVLDRFWIIAQARWMTISSP
ncbi:MAG TPA: outer membrane beta-barrel protein, partial [candidate division Zixibacteria bacterium]|nr:outer membrane beta-barrel protein [candidate division Zixibacteria bacterium]